MIGSLPNSTVYNTVINSFLCPSDTNAGLTAATATHASIGSTTYESPVNTPGMFAVWTSYGVSDCTDGTSNTIAFAEALTGQDNSGFGYGAQNTAGGTAYRGDVVVNATDPGTGGQGSDDPVGYYGKNAQFLMARQTPTPCSRGCRLAPRRGPTPECDYIHDARVHLGRWQWRVDLSQHHPDAQPRLRSSPAEAAGSEARI